MATRSELSVRASRVEGVLVRLLGVVVRRGFEPVAVTAALAAGGDALDVRLTVESERSADQLARHLGNLHDVTRVEVRRRDA